MERLKKALKQLESDSEFKEWKKENKECYFSYAFNMVKNSNELDDWQLGFYNKKNDKVTTFIIKKDDVEMKPEEDIFKKEETEIKEIDLKEAKLNIDDVLKKASGLQKEKYPKELPVKVILILQNLPGLGNLWNITYLTQSFNTLNIKISSSNGKILKHNLAALVDFKAK
ncbi:hypothetical protein KY360_02540 [Candidatus Woesearchaeota archaeon]|nr:hypothetical protein [Candidatus Woesearchaeota archaeon]